MIPITRIRKCHVKILISLATVYACPFAQTIQSVIFPKRIRQTPSDIWANVLQTGSESNVNIDG